MPFELFLALRYLYSRRRRPLARVTALAAVLGIAFGVAALIVAQALSNGFRDEMRDKILRGTAHITITRRDGERITDHASLVEQVRRVAGVRNAVATTYDGALIERDRASAYVVLRGLAAESTEAIADVRSMLVAGSVDGVFDLPPTFSKAGVPEPANDRAIYRDANGREVVVLNGRKTTGPVAAIIGSELAARFNLKPGDSCNLILADPRPSSSVSVMPGISVVVAGIVKTGLYEYDSSWLYVSLGNPNLFARSDTRVASMIAVNVEDIYRSSNVAFAIKSQLGPDFMTINWQEANRPLFSALALERRMGTAIIALIVIVAALNVTTTLVLVVVERRTDIAILRAMGARARSILALFVIEGAFVGLIGATFGVALGLLAIFAGNRYKLVSLPADVYSISNVPLHTNSRDIAISVASALLLSLLATIYPARAAARTRAAESLRD